MKKFTHAKAIAVLRKYARRLKRFHESSPSSDEPMIVGFRIDGSFGVGEDFFNAMRALRRTAKDAQRQSERERRREGGRL